MRHLLLRINYKKLKYQESGFQNSYMGGLMTWCIIVPMDLIILKQTWALNEVKFASIVSTKESIETDTITRSQPYTESAYIQLR